MSEKNDNLVQLFLDDAIDEAAVCDELERRVWERFDAKFREAYPNLFIQPELESTLKLVVRSLLEVLV